MECLVLQTERTRIRQLQETDLENLVRLERNPEVMKHITGKPRAIKEIDERFWNHLENYAIDPGFGVWAVCLRDQNKLIGTANLNFIPDTEIRQIGYKFFPEVQGKGLAAEVARELIRYGFLCCGLSEISAVCNPENLASEKVMQKAGMEYVGKQVYYGTECLHYRVDSEKWFLKNS